MIKLLIDKCGSFWFISVDIYSIAEWLRDGSRKHAEGLCAGLCRTCSVQPELLMNKGF